MAASGIIVMGEVLDWLDAGIGPAVSSAVDAAATKNGGSKAGTLPTLDVEILQASSSDAFRMTPLEEEAIPRPFLRVEGGQRGAILLKG